jgi:hypothetical protein
MVVSRRGSGLETLGEFPVSCGPDENSGAYLFHHTMIRAINLKNSQSVRTLLIFLAGRRGVGPVLSAKFVIRSNAQK